MLLFIHSFLTQFWSVHPFYNFLTQLSENQLPGEAAQVKLLPRPRGQEIMSRLFSDKCGYSSAVLILLDRGTDEKVMKDMFIYIHNQILHATRISCYRLYD